MREPVNKKLYNSIKRKSNRLFSKPGLGRSSWIVREYVKEGGTYRGKLDKKHSLKKAFRDWEKKYQKKYHGKTCRRGKR